MTHVTDVRGKRILVVEDEPMLALDLVMELEDAGADVSMARDLDGAMTACADQTLDGAILDVDLKGKDVFPAAEVLVAKGVPFVFHTGHAKASDLISRFPKAPVVAKPAPQGRLRAVLADLVSEDVRAA